MDYIQRKLSKSLNEHKDHLSTKMDSIVSDLAEHCSHEQLKGLVTASFTEKNNSLKLSFPDLKCTITTQRKFAFSNALEVFVKTSFYHGEDYICSVDLSPNGFAQIKNNFDNEILTYEYDDVDLTKAILHVLLLTLHNKGYIWIG